MDRQFLKVLGRRLFRVPLVLHFHLDFRLHLPLPKVRHFHLVRPHREVRHLLMAPLFR